MTPAKPKTPMLWSEVTSTINNRNYCASWDGCYFFWGTRHGKWMKEWPIELDYLPLNSMVSIANWTKGQRVSNKRATKIFYCAYISTLIPKLITVFSFALCPKLHASPFTRGLIMSQLMDSDVFQYIGQWNPRTNHQPTMVLNKSYPLYSVH